MDIRSLLARFADSRYVQDGVLRLTDLHLKAGQPPLYRLDDALVRLEEDPVLDAVALSEAIREFVGDERLKALEQDPRSDIDVGYSGSDETRRDGLSFRVNVFQDRDGPAVAVRVLPARVPEVEQLGLAPEVAEQIVSQRHGLLVVTGVTGSGKSTTVASILRRIGRERPVRIITLEDPIEYVLDGEQAMVSQRELGTHMETFHQGLRSALREDPDIIFVGEMRDQETAALALTAAETGHLVLSTMHTRDAKGAVTRLVDLFPSERSREISSQLSFGLSWVLAQKLVPRAGGQGRVAAIEVLKNVPAIGNMIRNGRWHQIYAGIEGHRRDGLITLERRLFEMVEKGLIRSDDARRFANDPAQLV